MYVGFRDCEAVTCGCDYYGSTVELLKDVHHQLDKFGELRTNNPAVVIAAKLLHQHKVFSVRVVKTMPFGEDDLWFDLDVDGNFLMPWPDEFFETSFHAQFWHGDLPEFE